MNQSFALNSLRFEEPQVVDASRRESLQLLDVGALAQRRPPAGRQRRRRDQPHLAHLQKRRPPAEDQPTDPRRLFQSGRKAIRFHQRKYCPGLIRIKFCMSAKSVSIVSSVCEEPLHEFAASSCVCFQWPILPFVLLFKLLPEP